jgi:TonB family protein
MRLAMFFTLSVALHASVLAYPIRFHSWNQDLLITVTIMPMASDSGVGTNESGHAGDPQSASNRQRPKTKPPDKIVETAHPVSAPVSTLPLVELAATKNPVDIATVGTISGASTSSAEGISAGTGNGEQGKGYGASGAGSGGGHGTGSSAGGSPLVQARYRNTPQPAYPENARREGREGRVLLHVLIDEQGKSKTVEVTRSSGSAALDRAAADAISRWRFHPARAGEKPVETWVNIPIDFRLTDKR